jgi:hypothetical protein
LDDDGARTDHGSGTDFHSICHHRTDPNGGPFADYRVATDHHSGRKAGVGFHGAVVIHGSPRVDNAAVTNLRIRIDDRSGRHHGSSANHTPGRDNRRRVNRNSKMAVRYLVENATRDLRTHAVISDRHNHLQLPQTVTQGRKIGYSSQHRNAHNLAALKMVGIIDPASDPNTSDRPENIEHDATVRGASSYDERSHNSASEENAIDDGHEKARTSHE